MDGEYGAQDHEWPVAGMRVAREIGMICYRSREEFDQRFDWGIAKEAAVSLGSSRSIMTGPVLEVEKYMDYMGEKFAVARYDPCCYLLQSRSMDLMDVGFGSSFSEGVLRINVSSLLPTRCLLSDHRDTGTTSRWTRRAAVLISSAVAWHVLNASDLLLRTGGEGLRMRHQAGRVDTIARAGEFCGAAEDWSR